MKLNDQQINLSQAIHSSIWLSSSSRDCVADMMRLSGAMVADDRQHLVLFVPEQHTKTFFENVQENRKVSFLCSSIYSYEAIQIKGLYLSHRPCTAEEVNYQKVYMNGFADNLGNVGLKSGKKIAAYFSENSVAISMKSEEIYEQTPKTGAGKKIS